MEIAKALSKDVRLLILDEPTAALNDTDSAHLLGLLRGLQDRGHHLDHHLAQAQRDRPRSPTTSRSSATARPSRRWTWHAGEVTQERIIRGMVGRDLDSYYPERESHPGEEVLRVEDWTVWHPTQDRMVVDHASFDVRAGEVVGIAGLMGAGRTELAMSIFGRSYGRDIVAAGSSCTARRSRPAASPRPSTHGIAYATEDRKKYGLNLIDDIRRNVSAAALGKLVPPRLGQRQRGDQGRRGEPPEHEHQGADA